MRLTLDGYSGAFVSSALLPSRSTSYFLNSIQPSSKSPTVKDVYFQSKPMKRTSPQCTLGFGFATPNQRDGNPTKALPDSETRCACGSEKVYGKCCRRFHTAQGTPQLAEDLLRSRYSAYAYRLPSYIMKTTHSSFAEVDRREWKREIMQFCQEYQFVGGVDIIEMQNPGPNTTRILFR